MIKFKQYLLEKIDIEKTIKNLGDKLERKLKKDPGAIRANITPFLLVQLVMGFDPTQNNKYVMWILRTYINNGVRYIEDLHRTQAALRTFDKFKQKMPKKDINQIKTLSDLEDMVEPFQDSKSNKAVGKEYKAKMDKESEILYHSGKDMILIPKTEEASCFWGKGTRWCTASTTSKNYFNYYHNKGPLYIIIKNGKKYQFHFKTKSYMDARDISVNDDGVFRWFFDKITEKIQISVVEANAYAIQYIKNPSEKVLKAANEK